jgi:hypothetical protein
MLDHHNSQIPTKNTVLKLKELHQIQVQDIILQDGWEQENWYGIRKLELKPIPLDNGDMIIKEFRDGYDLGFWKEHVMIPVR